MKKQPSKSEIFDALFHTKEEVRKRHRIRERTSYRNWKIQYQVLRNQKYTKKQIIFLLQWAHSLIDNHYGYGTATNASYVEESLVLLIEDYRTGLLK